MRPWSHLGGARSAGGHDGKDSEHAMGQHEEIRILNLEPEGYSPKARRILEGFAQVVDGPLPQDDLPGEVGKYDCVILRLGYHMDSCAFRATERLKVIATPTTGLDHIDVREAQERGIAVISLKGETEFLDSVRATSEHTMALILALIRRLPWAFDSVRRGKWDRDRFRGGELFGRTLGIVGLGRVGRHVAGYGQAFGMKVMGHNGGNPACLPGVMEVSLEELLEESEIITIHVPLSHETEGMLGRREFSLMRPGAILVNTSRGGIVDEGALLEALRTGQLSGAALDVLCGEPRYEKSWKVLPGLLEYAKYQGNLLITPHIGGATNESMERTEVFIAEKIRGFFASSATALG